MKFRITLVLSAIFMALGFAAFKMDDDPLTALVKKIDEYTNKYPQEKVHLHLDKPYYAIGDDIWFKAYVLNTKTQAPTNISKILYVELINEKDSLKKQLKLPLMGGITWGDFKLPDSLTEGNYRIRAYTTYMRNFGTDFFFDKTIKIGNSWANKVFTSTEYKFTKENTIYLRSDIANNGSDNILQEVFSVQSSDYSSIVFQQYNIDGYSKQIVGNSNNVYRFYLTDEIAILLI